MSSTPTIAQLLDELRVALMRDWPTELSDSESRLLMGLRQLEAYTSVLVAAWIEGVFNELEYAELSDSDMVSHVVECAEYIDGAMNLNDDVLRSGWRVTHKMLSGLRHESNGRELARKAIVLFFAALALRSCAESLLGGDGSQLLAADGRRIANGFFSRVCEHLEETRLPVRVDVSPAQFLTSLERDLQSVNWI